MKRRVLLALLPVVAAACGGGGDEPTQVGIRRVALALAFSEEELAEPVPPRVITQLVPTAPTVEFTDTEVVIPDVVVGVAPQCPTLAPGASAEVPVTFEVTGPPAPGAYGRHNSGSIDVTGGPFPITLPYPFISTDTVSVPETVDVEPAPGVPATEQATEYEITRDLGFGFQTTDRYRVTARAVELVSRTTVTPGQTSEFRPTPPIDVYVFGVENSSWNDAGVDNENGTAMAFRGRIEKREVVDVCGTAVDTYRVLAEETTVNLETGQTSGTSSGDPNIYNVATQFGGLIVRADVHTTDTTRDPNSDAPLVLEFDYVSTLDSVEPRS